MCWCVVVLFCCVTLLLCCCVVGLSFCCFVVVVLFCCAVVVLFCHSGLPTVGCGCVLQLRDLQPNRHRYGLLNCGQVNPYPNNTGGLRHPCSTKGGTRLAKKDTKSWCLTLEEAQERVKNHVWFSSAHSNETDTSKQRAIDSRAGIYTQWHYSDGRITDVQPYIYQAPSTSSRPDSQTPIGMPRTPIGLRNKRGRSPSRSTTVAPSENPAKRLEQRNGGRSKWSEFEP